MGQSFGNQFTLVEVATDAAVRGIAHRELWVAAAKPEQALTLVLSAIPESFRRDPNARTAGASQARRGPQVDELRPPAGIGSEN